MNAKPSADDFEMLWSQMYGRLCRFVCSRLSNSEDAEDILQDIFLRIYYQLGTVHDPARLESWVFQIARNRIIDLYRGRRNWTDLSETMVDSAEPEKEASAELAPRLREMVDSLPDPYREALILADLQGLPQQDLADRLAISLSGAKSRVQRARQKVKTAMLQCFDFEFDARGGLMDFQMHCCC